MRPEHDLPMPFRAVWHALYWTSERATWQYDVMVLLILAFVWLTPPDWLNDPMAHGGGPIAWVLGMGRYTGAQGPRGRGTESTRRRLVSARILREPGAART